MFNVAYCSLMENIEKNNISSYEPEGREFESLRARQNSKKAYGFISISLFYYFSATLSAQNHSQIKIPDSSLLAQSRFTGSVNPNH